MAINLKKEIFEEDIVPVSAINLEKSVKPVEINLEKPNQNVIETTNVGGLTKLAVKLIHGNTNVKKSRFLRKLKVDCDLAAIFIGDDGRIVGNNGVDSCVFYGRTSAYDNGVILTGDGSGNSELYMEHLYIDTNKLPKEVKNVFFVVTIYRAYFNKLNFGSTNGLEVRIVDVDKQVEMDFIEIANRFRNYNGLICGGISKVDGKWTYNYIEKPVSGVGNVSAILKWFV